MRFNMLENNIFRLAMILSSGQAQSFHTNLKKLINLVLYDSFGTPIKISQIRSMIQEQYSLEFSDSELINVIREDKNIITSIYADPVDNTFELHPSEYKKIQGKQTVNVDDYILKFLESSMSEETWEFACVKNLIYKFLYFSFNSDRKTVLELMNRKLTEPGTYCVSDEFSPDEAKIINAFLNWNYPPKNEFVLNLISSCFDYCMLTVKKDTTSYSNIFNGKEFYLDSNIIFRLAGFNNSERQTSINAFIKKCTDAGIKVCYTNHTYAEIKNTIKYYVENLQKLLGTQQPLSTVAMRSLSSKYANLDFHDMYVEWCKIPTNSVGDFKSFENYLERKISKYIEPFKLVAINNYDTRKNHKQFEELCDDFTAYKTEHYKNTYEGAIRVDINNYSYLLEKASENDAADFMQLKYYFITADHCLTEWAALQRPGIVPMFVLPSVWYSILLKYKGRTDKDYAAFCQFLNIRIAPERDEQLDQKRIMLAHILDLNEDREIKEQIIFDIKNRLSDPQISIENPIAFVEESHQTILQSRIEQELSKSQAKHDKEMLEIVAASDKKLQSELKKTELESAKKIESVQTESYNKGRDEIISKQANKIAKRNNGIIIAFWIIFCITVLIFISTFIIDWTLGDKEITNKIIKWYNDNETAIKIVSSSCSVLIFGINIVLSKTKILTSDASYIFEKLRKKYE